MERRQEEALRRQQLDQMRSERDGLRDATVALQATVKKFETDRDELVKCLEEARRRISGMAYDPSFRFELVPLKNKIFFFIFVLFHSLIF